MRFFAVFILFPLLFSPTLPAQETSLAPMEAAEDLWVETWTNADKTLKNENLKTSRAIALRVISHYVLQSFSSYAFLLMREEPTSEFSQAASDLTKIFSGVLREMSLERFLSEVTGESGLLYNPKVPLADIGVTHQELRQATRKWLRHFISGQFDPPAKYEVGVTVLRIDLKDLWLARRPSLEFRLIMRELRDLMLQENTINLRVILSATPEAWNFIRGNPVLLAPFLNLADSVSLVVVDGSKLEVETDCEGLLRKDN